MNIENINKLIEHLKTQGPDNFHMRDWLRTPIKGDESFGMANAWMVLSDPEPYHELFKKNSCGTVACLAGHAIVLSVSEGTVASYTEQLDGAKEFGRKFLGLTLEQARSLFIVEDIDSDELGIPEAINTLEYLKETGIVAWRTANPDLNWRNYTDEP